MEEGYNYKAFDAVTGEEIAWGTFKTKNPLNKCELANRARNLAYAFFAKNDVRVEIMYCDLTSGDFDSIGGVIAQYQTQEN